jgi:hypothetical protein
MESHFGFHCKCGVKMIFLNKKKRLYSKGVRDDMV